MTILIAFSSLSELSGNSIFMHRRGRATYDQISAVGVNGNKHAYQLQTGLVSYMILNLHGNETCNSCDQRFFFSQHFERKLGKKKNLWHPGYILIGKKRCTTNSIFLFSGLQKLCRHFDMAVFHFILVRRISIL